MTNIKLSRNFGNPVTFSKLSIGCMFFGIDTNRLYIKIEESTDEFGKEYNAIGIGAAYPEAFSPESKVIYVRKVSINTNS